MIFHSLLLSLKKKEVKQTKDETLKKSINVITQGSI